MGKSLLLSKDISRFSILTVSSSPSASHNDILEESLQLSVYSVTDEALLRLTNIILKKNSSKKVLMYSRCQSL